MLLSLNNVTKRFDSPGVSKEHASPLEVLHDITFSMGSNEFVAIVGPSGCGKSTLLRIIAGIEAPSSGKINFYVHPSVSMIFQSFALLPWRTVYQNIQLALEAFKLPKEEMNERIMKFIDRVGLQGFENAYPEELSGGMKQRVGIARAMVVEPNLLCMDEPFSSLDVLTAENLRREILMLWSANELPPDAIIMVTHNIEEAVFMADRIIVLSTTPAKIIGDIKVELPRPRDKKGAKFQEYTDEIYSLLA